MTHLSLNPYVLLIPLQKNHFDKIKLSENINRELQAIYDWLCVNKLSLNIPKTKFMLFHHKQRKIDSIVPNLSINGNAIDHVTKFNFLGFLIDENLSFDSHIDMLSTKISRSLGVLNKLKKFFCIILCLRCITHLYYLTFNMQFYVGDTKLHAYLSFRKEQLELSHVADTMHTQIQFSKN